MCNTSGGRVHPSSQHLSMRTFRCSCCLFYQFESTHNSMSFRCGAVPPLVNSTTGHSHAFLNASSAPGITCTAQNQCWP